MSHYGVSNFSQSSLFTGYYRKRVFMMAIGLTPVGKLLFISI